MSTRSNLVTMVKKDDNLSGPLELVDIVDEENNVLYQTTKQEAHQNGLLHRAIIGEIIDSKGRWVLTQQAADRQDPGQFVSPVGGHIRAGESEIDALKREAQEETGITDFTFKYIGRTIYQREVIGRKENHFFSLYEIHADNDLVLNHESISFKWFTQKALHKLVKESPDKFGEAFFKILDTFYPSLRS